MKTHPKGGTVIPPIIQICIAVITLAITAIAVVTIRAMKSFGRAADEIRKTSETTQKLMDDVQAIERSLREMAEELGGLIPRLKGVWSRFGNIGHRASHLTNGSLDDVRETVRQAVSTMRAARELSGLVFRKVANSASRIRSNGG